MTELEVLTIVTAIFHDIFDDPSLVITDQTTAENVEAWDSVNHILLVVEVERQFKVKFRTAEIETLHNVGDLVRLILRKSAGNRS